LKNAIVLAFFSCGCNQSQIFPRSGHKCNIHFANKKRVFGIIFLGVAVFNLDNLPEVKRFRFRLKHLISFI